MVETHPRELNELQDRACSVLLWKEGTIIIAIVNTKSYQVSNFKRRKGSGVGIEVCREFSSPIVIHTVLWEIGEN